MSKNSNNNYNFNRFNYSNTNAKAFKSDSKENQNKEKVKQLLSLNKGTEKYKMVIPENVEDKIRFLCEKISEVEWSGTLFYTVEGTFENNDLVVTCKDLFLMNIGNATYTEFDMSPDVISYMAYNPELLECKTGLIHSHNNMSK